KGIVRCPRCCILCETPDACSECPTGSKHIECLADVPCGLHIIGTERHESRRIDRQLRGRAGRQGDPGASRFFISLEDDLMRLFGSERISGVMDRLGVEEGEVITHSFITKAIERSQKRVELYNFGIRKRLLEYDDVMNKQREVIYGRRNEILGTEDLDSMVHGLIDNVIDQVADKYLPPESLPESWDLAGMAADLEGLFLFPVDIDALPGETRMSEQAVIEWFRGVGREAFEVRKTMIPPEIMQQLERMIMLQSIDEKWMDHLRELDSLREGIHFRSYAQKDPLVEYKQEAFEMFGEMVDDIDRSVLWALFHARVEPADRDRRRRSAPAGTAVHRTVDAYRAAQAQPAAAPAAAPHGSGPLGPGPGQPPTRSETRTREEPKVGRNDPCPCGSGRKYKKCCGKNAT
ncbi:MAG: SEC-C metal-binding domain-containing protein, partial [Candidatus Krumholzibacteria bacterium]|nr:SEC-C metal-binding domain-containing protein [Candidatus Krumholzibacteria bacterium]